MVGDGALLVDTRPGWQREQEGDAPGCAVIERNHLEWRLDPTSDARIPQAVDHDVTWIVVCSEGYASSLAAASLQDLGLRNATDLDGGFRAWKAAGLPVGERPVLGPRRPTPACCRGMGDQERGPASWPEQRDVRPAAPA